jgi:nitrate reductase NapD
MANSQNICGVAVYLSPGAGADLTAKILALPGVELQAASGKNRLAATIVDTPTSMAIDQIAAIHRLSGVVAASLVFHAVDESDGGVESCHDNTCEDNAACCAGTGRNGRAGVPIQKSEIR